MTKIVVLRPQGEGGRGGGRGGGTYSQKNPAKIGVAAYLTKYSVNVAHKHFLIQLQTLN